MTADTTPTLLKRRQGSDSDGAPPALPRRLSGDTTRSIEKFRISCQYNKNARGESNLTSFSSSIRLKTRVTVSLILQ